ncbi:hypothetical protein POL68_25685 [Stigmatella sp. ncwal1]|uniref:Uncharacterized protein n=1 Tax=Stigmatella ashevillensis TaxID=2995309 RepID=A0ABT5DHP4_9BACT|nr:hypothetical protein [Stigmatella ashevillena]MDC0711886.1 hypothetical protein [Stigmatella ashevillena]
MGVLAVGSAEGCAYGQNPVTGRLTPQHFRFKVVTAASPRKPSGWRAVCIHARITQGDSGATTVCKFEVGLPIQNEQQGNISLKYAQQVSANTANRAVYDVLSEAHPGEMLAVLCLDFKEEYGRTLGERVSGSRVSECVTAGIETVYFDLPEGVKP